MRDRSKVVVVPCAEYDEEKVYLALKAGIDALGGIAEFVRPDESILVKPNFLGPSDVEKAVTTHPSVIRGMLRILNEAGCSDVKYGDSPGYGTCKAASLKLGLSTDNIYGASMADMSTEKTVEFPEGTECKEFHFTTEIADSDAIISLCKMKTHALETITGAVKNVYGFVCGYRKAAGHVKYPNATMFARMLCDIHKCRTPRLNIMDGIIAMEGNGPGSGTPTPMKVMLFSTDPVALDSVFCYLVNVDPEAIPTCSQGRELGIGTDIEDNIDIVLVKAFDESGNPAVPCESLGLSREELFTAYGNPDFDIPRNKAPKSLLARYSAFMTKISRRPRIDASLCRQCGMCVSHCPVPGKAVTFKNGPGTVPVYDYSKCIRCYCCQEMCPEHAITAGRRKK